MIEIKLIWIQMFTFSVVLWVGLNIVVFILNVFIFFGDDDQLKRTPLIATGLWIGIVLYYVLAYFVKIVP
jgi:hypothetical protein